MGAEEILSLLLQSLRLKWVVRTGWAMRGVPSPESVADHSWGVALLALILAEEVEQALNREKLLSIALLHDLPEAALSDIPSPVLRHLPPQAKREAEQGVLVEMLSSLKGAEKLLLWWQEFEEHSTPEGRLVRDADKLDMLVQAYLYEESRGSRLSEFWAGQEERSFHYAASQALYEALLKHRGTAAPQE